MTQGLWRSLECFRPQASENLTQPTNNLSLFLANCQVFSAFCLLAKGRNHFNWFDTIAPGNLLESARGIYRWPCWSTLAASVPTQCWVLVWETERDTFSTKLHQHNVWSSGGFRVKHFLAIMPTKIIMYPRLLVWFKKRIKLIHSSIPNHQKHATKTLCKTNHTWNILHQLRYIRNLEPKNRRFCVVASHISGPSTWTNPFKWLISSKGAYFFGGKGSLSHPSVFLLEDLAWLGAKQHTSSGTRVPMMLLIASCLVSKHQDLLGKTLAISTHHWKNNGKNNKKYVPRCKVAKI